MRTRHFLQLVALSALWGASFMLIRIAAPVLTPNVLAVLRVGAATVTLAILMRAMRHTWPSHHWKEIVLLGALAVAMPFLLFAWAALQLPAGYSALFNAIAVVFGIFTSAWLKEDTLTLRKLLGCVCGFAGIAMIVGLGPVEPSFKVFMAALGCIAASACYGSAPPLMKRALNRMQPLEIAAGIHAVAVLMLLPGALWSWPQAQFTPTALMAVGVMGIVTSGLAYWVHIRILAEVTPVAAMSPTFMIPVFGVAWGHIFLGEQLGAGIFLGGALVLLACALITGFNPWEKWLDFVDAKL